MENIYGVSEEVLKFRPSYVYKITLKEDGRIYYGSRISSTFRPSDDLWVKYFTSSGNMKDLLSIYEPYSGSWDYEVIEEFEDYESAVKYENNLLRSIPKSERHLYININFSAGGAIIKSNRHSKFLNNSTGLIELFPLGTPLPEGYTNNNQVPPSRKGLRTWINPITYEIGQCLIEDIPEGAIIKTEFDRLNKLEEKRIKQEKLEEFRKNRVKHVITNGKQNKTVYTDLPIPENWYIGKTIFSPGMKGKKHSEETKKIMSENMTGAKSGYSAWNKGMTKENNSTLARVSEINKKNYNPNQRTPAGYSMFINKETGAEKCCLESPGEGWVKGSKKTAITTPYGDFYGEKEIKEKLNLSMYKVKNKMKEFPNEWHYKNF